jgi:hypothetical protein
MKHTVELRPARVVKRFAPGAAETYEREHRALTLLTAHAPGLAPAPLPFAFPALEMTRLPGEPLRGTVLDPARVAALARTVQALHDAIPAPVLAGLPPRPDDQAHVVARLRAWYAADAADRADPNGSNGSKGSADSVGAGHDPLVARAMAAGLAWLDRTDLAPGHDPATDLAPDPDLPAVFGPGDGNLANYLWDGSRVTVVDFEYSGRSDRAYELAEITEHVSSWVESELDVAGFLGHFRLTPAETARLGDCRRLLSLVWLFLLRFDDPAAPRNPPGTARRQAARVLERLAAAG